MERIRSVVPILAFMALAARTHAAPVRVHVVAASTDGQTPRGVYFALYAADDPWREPTAETVAPGGDAVFQVEPGTYELLAYAGDREPAAQRLDVQERRPAEARIALVAAFEANGSVSDPAGRPVAGARVRLVHNGLSELAAAHIAKAFETKTDANGWWSLSVPTSRWTPLLIEAPGYAPAWLRSDAKSGVVVLQPGGAVTLQLDRVDTDAVVLLSPVGELPGALTSTERYADLVSQPATPATLHWAAVAAGEYRVVVKPRNPTLAAWSLLANGQGGSLKSIGTVNVTSGETAELRIE
jgi:hypothetical protein